MAGEWGLAGPVGCLGGLLRGLALTLVRLPFTASRMGEEMGRAKPLVAPSPAWGWPGLSP